MAHGTAVQRPARRSGFRKHANRRRLTWIVFLLPALLIYLGFMAIPLFNSLGLSFYTGAGLRPDRFVGVANYVELFTNPLWRDRFLNALGNTVIFFSIHMLVQNTLGLLFALLLASGIKGNGFIRTIIFIPATLSVLVIGFLWRLILNPQWGAVNQILKRVGLGEWALPWLGEPGLVLIIISLVSSWQWVGLPTMMFLAGLLTIPDDLLEAARVDGANAWQTFWRIQLPLLVPVIGIVAILTFVGNFNAFDLIYVAQGALAGPDFSTDILGTFLYRTFFGFQLQLGDPYMGSAIAGAMFAIILLGVCVYLFGIQTRLRRYQF